MAFVEPLDLETMLVNTLAGSIEIFTFIAFIAIAAVAARFKMPNLIVFIMFSVFAIFMANFIGNSFYLVIMIFAGLMIFNIISKIISR